MPKEESRKRKRVSVSQLKPGVYVVDLDRSWFQTRFYFHRRLIKDKKDIEALKKHGIREVVIDIARGADVDAPLADPLPEISTAVPGEPPAHSNAPFPERFIYSCGKCLRPLPGDWKIGGI
jgi:hypothetical protein